MKIGPRERDILAAICRQYILTGEPVGSRALVRRQGIEQSAATVRNVMADLEERGLVQKPHTSAGRVPTDVGLRFFVDRLMSARALSEAEQAEIRKRFQLSNVELQALLREISRLLSEVSQQCAVVLVPRSEASQLRRIEFVPLRQGQMLAVLVMSSGLVQNRLLPFGEALLADELEHVHRYLNDLCAGRELSEVRRVVAEELENEQVRYDKLMQRALRLGAEAVATPGADELVIDGQSNLLERAEGGDLDQVKALLKAVEEKKVVLRLLEETIQARGVQVFIGAETNEQEMRGSALVASAYGEGRPLGTVGVLGPSNMDFPRVLPLVDYTAAVLTELLRD